MKKLFSLIFLLIISHHHSWVIEDVQVEDVIYHHWGEWPSELRRYIEN